MDAYKKEFEKIFTATCYLRVNAIRKTTQVLREYFGIAGFSYQKTNKNGSYFCLTDTPELADYCIEKKYHLNNPYLRDPDTLPSGLVFNDRVIHDEETKNQVKFSDRSFDLSNTVALIEKGATHAELIYLIAKPGNKNLNTLAWNHQLLLKKFLTYFKEEHKVLFRQAEDESINLAKWMPQNFFRMDPFFKAISTERQHLLLKSMGYQPIIKKGSLLSIREKECLRLLLFGKTAKESGGCLQLSQRTVESYLENMKNKLGCSNKAELFNQALLFHELNLL